MTAMFTTPPECDKPDQCRFVKGPVGQALFEVEYDREGNEVPLAARSWALQYWRCNTCGTMWSEVINGAPAQNGDEVKG